jgi:hypothetical protein
MPFKKGVAANPRGIGGFEPGRSGNLNGRPRQDSVLPKIVKQGDSIDCLEYLQAVIDSSASNRDKLQAAAILAPFKHVKATGKTLSRTIDLDPPKNLPEALEQRRQIMALERVRYITTEEAALLISELDGFVEAVRGTNQDERIARLERTLEERGVPIVGVVIEGGLGPLPMPPNQPGIIMPNLDAIDPIADPKSEPET